MILVTGVSGCTGNELVRPLLAHGARVRSLVRDPAKVAPHQQLGAEVVAVGNFLQPATLDPAPVFIGDTIQLEGEVTALEEKDDHRGVVTFHQEVMNQRGETVAVLDKRTLNKRRAA